MYRRELGEMDGVRECLVGRKEGRAIDVHAIACIASFAIAGIAMAQSTTRVSVDSSGAQANGSSGTGGGGSISADGRYIVFSSFASTLVPGDTNGLPDIFLHDRQTGMTTLVSVSASGGPANGISDKPCISADGRYVVFESDANNLVANDVNGNRDVFVRDLQMDTNTLVSVSSSGEQGNVNTNAGNTGPHISADGRYAAFWSAADNLVPGDTNGCGDIFVHDLFSATTERVSVDSSGQQGNALSFDSAISADGRYVVFSSSADNLVPGDTNERGDIFVRDLQLGTTVRVSVDSSGVQGNETSSWGVSISADDRYVAFCSSSTNLVPGDTNSANDIFVHDLQTGTTRCASVDPAGAMGNSHSYYPSLSADGRFVVFQSDATNLVPLDTSLSTDVFVHDLQTGANARVSVDSSGAQGGNSSGGGSLSADGSVVAFSSLANNLVVGDTNGVGDAFAFVPSEVNVEHFCSGDGTASACPCGNSGISFHGCENSNSTGGAFLSASGFAGLANDTLHLSSSGERWTALSLFIQGDQEIVPAMFGDGLRCVGGNLLRLYAHNADMGIANAPAPGDPSVSARSAALGDVIPLGGARWYQAYYRDPAEDFCPDPQGSTFNVSNGLRVIWAQ